MRGKGGIHTFLFLAVLGFIAGHGLSPVVDSKGSSLVGVRGLLILGASLVEHRLQAHGVP